MGCGGTGEQVCSGLPWQVAAKLPVGKFCLGKLIGVLKCVGMPHCAPSLVASLCAAGDGAVLELMRLRIHNLINNTLRLM